jgi:O-antigen/teichoic acid export membrane protein
MDASLPEQASVMLRDVNFLYGVVSGLLLKYSFEWSRNRTEFKRNEVLLSLAMGVGALVLALVLVAVMAEVAVPALEAGGTVHYVLVLFVFAWFVMLGMTVTALYAIYRAVTDLWAFREDLRQGR